MIGAISGTSQFPRLPQVSSGQNPNKARVASLEKQIDALEAKAKTCGCADTAAEAFKQATALKAELSSLQASESKSAAAPSDAAASIAPQRPPESEQYPSISADPKSADAGGNPKRSEGDYRPIATKASTAVQIALSNLNSGDPWASRQNI